jgi:hypothetical protein
LSRWRGHRVGRPSSAQPSTEHLSLPRKFQQSELAKPFDRSGTPGRCRVPSAAHRAISQWPRASGSLVRRPVFTGPWSGSCRP